MSQIKIGYKLVYKKNKNKKLSFAQHPDNGGILYYFSKWSKPKDGFGPLFVFKSLKSAKEYINIYPLHVLKDVVLYKCYYFSTKRRVYNQYGFSIRLDKGIVLANRVKLIKGEIKYVG